MLKVLRQTVFESRCIQLGLWERVPDKRSSNPECSVTKLGLVLATAQRNLYYNKDWNYTCLNACTTQGLRCNSTFYKFPYFSMTSSPSMFGHFQIRVYPECKTSAYLECIRNPPEGPYLLLDRLMLSQLDLKCCHIFNFYTKGRRRKTLLNTFMRKTLPYIHYLEFHRFYCERPQSSWTKLDISSPYLWITSQDE